MKILLTKNKEKPFLIDYLRDVSEEIVLLKIENENLSQSMTDVKLNYKNTIDDYEYLKNQFCEKCVGKPIEIGYESERNLEIYLNNRNEYNNTIANNEVENENFINDDNTNKINELNASKIVESFMSESKICVYVNRF